MQAYTTLVSFVNFKKEYNFLSEYDQLSSAKIFKQKFDSLTTNIPLGLKSNRHLLLSDFYIRTQVDQYVNFSSSIAICLS